MGQDSKIAWTDHTFNPWWGCTPASTGCAHCYAAAFAKRTGQDCFGASPRRFFGEKHWAEPLKWAKAARKAGVRAKVFCASMADVFEDAPGLDEQRARLFDLIQRTPELDWLLLTKRADRMVQWFGGASGAGLEAPPIRNLWLGVTVENQEAAEERIPLLLQAPAAVRFLSCEPLVGEVDIAYVAFNGADSFGSMPGIDWVIVGGESGANARAFYLEWARSIVGQCRRAGVPVFVKQLGRCASDPENGLAGHGLRVPRESECLISNRLTDIDGRDLAEWPEDLRVQEFPTTANEGEVA